MYIYLINFIIKLKLFSINVYKLLVNANYNNAVNIYHLFLCSEYNDKKV